MLQSLKQLAAGRGYRGVIVPVRPSWKARYPLTPIENYVTWTDENKNCFDPWLRSHIKAGGKMLKIAGRSMTVKATVAQWENWTGLKFPESGSYVIPKGLQPLEIDKGGDSGIYTEPNIWFKHEIAT